MGKKENHKLPFFRCPFGNSHPDFPVTSVFRKTTYTGLLTYYYHYYFFSFTPFSYKMGLISTLLDMAYKINNNWNGFSH